MTNTNSKGIIILAFIGLWISGLPSASYCQSTETNETYNEPKEGIELLIPVIDDKTVNFPTSVVNFFLHFPINKNVIFQAELPLSVFHGKDLSGYKQKETSIGNPYLGVRFNTTNSHAKIDMGIHLPVAPTNNIATVSGIAVKYYDLAAFLPKTFSIPLNVDYTLPVQNFMFQLGGGPEFIFNNDDAKVLLNYYGVLTYPIDHFAISAGFAGYTIFSGKVDNGIKSLIFKSSYNFSRYHFGLSVRRPLDKNFNDVVKFIIGATFSMGI